jgi:hypothetical protein
MRRAGAGIDTEQGWEQALRRMPAADRAQLGNRWRDPAFRAAYAADVAEAYDPPPASSRTAGPWLSAWASTRP